MTLFPSIYSSHWETNSMKNPERDREFNALTFFFLEPSEHHVHAFES